MKIADILLNILFLSLYLSENKLLAKQFFSHKPKINFCIPSQIEISNCPNNAKSPFYLKATILNSSNCSISNRRIYWEILSESYSKDNQIFIEDNNYGINISLEIWNFNKSGEIFYIEPTKILAQSYVVLVHLYENLFDGLQSIKSFSYDSCRIKNLQPNFFQKFQIKNSSHNKLHKRDTLLDKCIGQTPVENCNLDFISDEYFKIDCTNILGNPHFKMIKELQDTIPEEIEISDIDSFFTSLSKIPQNGFKLEVKEDGFQAVVFEFQKNATLPNRFCQPLTCYVSPILGLVNQTKFKISCPNMNESQYEDGRQFFVYCYTVDNKFFLGSGKKLESLNFTVPEFECRIEVFAVNEENELFIDFIDLEGPLTLTKDPNIFDSDPKQSNSSSDGKSMFHDIGDDIKKPIVSASDHVKNVSHHNEVVKVVAENSLYFAVGLVGVILFLGLLVLLGTIYSDKKYIYKG